MENTARSSLQFGPVSGQNTSLALKNQAQVVYKCTKLPTSSIACSVVLFVRQKLIPAPVLTQLVSV